MSEYDAALRNTITTYLAGLSTESEVIDSAMTALGAALVPTDALTELAGLAGRTHGGSDFNTLLSRVLHELGLTYPHRDELAKVFTITISGEICENRLDPVDGANTLWSKREEFGDPFQILPDLIQLVDEWESTMDRRAEISNQIREIACRLRQTTA